MRYDVTGCSVFSAHWQSREPFSQTGKSLRFWCIDESKMPKVNASESEWLIMFLFATSFAVCTLSKINIYWNRTTNCLTWNTTLSCLYVSVWEKPTGNLCGLCLMHKEETAIVGVAPIGAVIRGEDRSTLESSVWVIFQGAYLILHTKDAHRCRCCIWGTNS